MSTPKRSPAAIGSSTLNSSFLPLSTGPNGNSAPPVSPSIVRRLKDPEAPFTLTPTISPVTGETYFAVIAETVQPPGSAQGTEPSTFELPSVGPTVTFAAPAPDAASEPAQRDIA